MRRMIYAVALLFAVGCQQRDFSPEPEQESKPVVVKGKPLPPKPAHLVVIDRVNKANAYVKSLTADIKTVTRRRAITFTANGKMYFQKDKNFRIVNHQAMDGTLSADIGSNDQYFWFYIKRLNQKEVFYANYANINDTRLKSSLHPLWMMESVNLLPVSDQGIVRSGRRTDTGLWFIDQSRENTRQQQVVMTTIIDPEKSTCVTHYIRSAGGKTLAKSEIKSFSKVKGVYMPSLIELTLPDEQVTVTQQIYNVRLNVSISNSVWSMPDLGLRTVDLSKTVVERVNGR